MYCSKCGAAIPDDVKFCPACGTPTAPAAAAPDAQNEQSAQPNAYAQQQNPYSQQQNASARQQGAYGQQQPNMPPAYNAPPHAENPPRFFDCGIQQRDIAVTIILSIVTCGIYGIYWFIKQVDDVNRAANDQNAYSGGITFLLGAVTCGIYALYWYYQAGKKMSYAQRVRGLPVKDNQEILYLLLGLFGCGIVSMALIQSDLNKMATPNA